MKIGKVPENVLKRSVMKQLHYKRDEVVLGPGIGEDCAALALAEDEILVMSTDPITGTAKDIGKIAIQITANDLASAGAEPIGVMLTILLPDGTREIALKRIMEQMECACREAKMQILGGHTEVTAVVNQPVVNVAGVAKAKKGSLISTAGARAGMDIVVSKWVGIEGTMIFAKEKEAELKEHFPADFVDTAIGFDRYLSVVPEAAVATQSSVAAMHDVTEGGLFGALWEMAEASGVGLEIDLKKIPIRQETVEICEYFDVNPYGLISSGMMLMASADGNALVLALQEAGIPATVIGKATEGNDRVIIRDEERRFLEPPKTDELYKVL
ncbi:hydrogenase maturation factor [Roseburia sp. NSJ-9]|uniref:Hydrogenase maturation factor n=1 Tax=Roseburia lenta TaxID=2763061 RepID=A0ABR7GER0_9FIRM|nr:AIR synthase family protein [Roseburia lenta]MBC5685933.1 hydrogenase maturation factor [Roseburia lenta]